MVSQDMIRRFGGHAAALLIVLTASVLFQGPSHAQQVTDLTQEESVQQRRNIMEMQDRIRLLSAQGSFLEVLREAEDLLREDPENKTAIFYKDIAERRLAEGFSGPGGQRVVDPTVEGEIPLSAVVPDLRPEPGQVTFAERSSNELPAPEPLAPRRGSLSRSNNLRPVLIGLSVTVFIGLIVLVVIWLINRRRQAALPPAKPLAMPTSFGAFGDRPTAHSEITRHNTATNYADPRTGADPLTGADPRTGVDPRTAADPRTGVDPNADLFDQPTMQDYEDKPKKAAATAPSPQRKPQPAPPVPEPEVERDSIGLEGLMLDAAPSAELGSSMGIDYSDTDSPFSRSQASDVYQTQGGAFSGTPEETIGSPRKPEVASKQPVKASEPDPLADPKSSISFDFDLTSPTQEVPRPNIPPAAAPAPPPSAKAVPPPASKKPAPAFDISAPAPPIDADAPAASSASQDSDAATFNALMFGGGAPAVPPPAPEAKSPAPAAAAPSNEEMTFNSLMFGGGAPAPAPSPAAPPEIAPAAASASDKEELTFNSLMFGGGASEDTRNIAPPAAGSPAGTPASAGQEEMTFNSLMFGGADETKAPAAPSPASAPAPAAPIPDPEDMEKTGILPPVKEAPAAAAAPKAGSMFERQRDAGKAAMAEQDYAKAVQCFSVAASLKPADKEIRELLEEARRLRRG